MGSAQTAALQGTLQRMVLVRFVFSLKFMCLFLYFWVRFVGCFWRRFCQGGYLCVCTCVHVRERDFFQSIFPASLFQWDPKGLASSDCYLWFVTFTGSLSKTVFSEISSSEILKGTRLRTATFSLSLSLVFPRRIFSEIFQWYPKGHASYDCYL